MNDISYEILDQLKAYGADRQALDKILSENSRPEFLLSPWIQLKYLYL